MGIGLEVERRRVAHLGLGLLAGVQEAGVARSCSRLRPAELQEEEVGMSVAR